jgi:hypothetical protein
MCKDMDQNWYEAMFFPRTRRTCPDLAQQLEVQIRPDTIKQKAPTCWKSCKDQ